MDPTRLVGVACSLLPTDVLGTWLFAGVSMKEGGTGTNYCDFTRSILHDNDVVQRRQPRCIVPQPNLRSTRVMIAPSLTTRRGKMGEKKKKEQKNGMSRRQKKRGSLVPRERQLIGQQWRRKVSSAGTRDECYTPSLAISIFCIPHL